MDIPRSSSRSPSPSAVPGTSPRIPQEGRSPDGRAVSRGHSDAAPRRPSPVPADSKHSLPGAHTSGSGALTLGGKRRRGADDVGGSDALLRPRTGAAEPGAPVRPTFREEANGAKQRELTRQAQALLEEAGTALSGSVRSLESAPLPIELRCAAFEIECYQFMLRRDDAASAPSSDQALGAARTALRKALQVTMGDAPIHDGAIVAFFEPVLSRSDAGSRTSESACAFALRAGGTAMPAELLENLRYQLLHTTSVYDYWDEFDGGVEINDQQREAMIRGLAAAVMMDADPCASQPGLTLLQHWHYFNQDTNDHVPEYDAEVADRSLVPTARALHLDDRPPSALKNILRKLMPYEGDRTFLSETTSAHLNKQHWAPSAETAALARALGGARMPAPIYQVLENHLMRCIAGGSLDESVQAVVALRVVCGPRERLLGALLARAHALGLACQRGQPAPLDAAPIVETLDWLTHPDRFKPRSGITLWGPSRLAVDADQQKDLLAVMAEVRDTFIDTTAESSEDAVSVASDAEPDVEAGPPGKDERQ